jgi:hypothetical protein
VGNASSSTHPHVASSDHPTPWELGTLGTQQMQNNGSSPHVLSPAELGFCASNLFQDMLVGSQGRVWGV